MQPSGDWIMARSSISVAVVEDDATQRAHLVQLIDEAPDMHCWGGFEDAEHLMARLMMDGEAEPDVILMDISLRGAGRSDRMSGIEATSRVKSRHPEVAIVMLTAQDEPAVMYEAIEVGACGYLVKPSSEDDIVGGIRDAHRGGLRMPPPLAKRVRTFFQERPARRQEYTLSEREREVLRLMEQGCKQWEIANRLYLSRHTVDSHLRNVYQKLHVNSAPEAIGKAIRVGEI